MPLAPRIDRYLNAISDGWSAAFDTPVVDLPGDHFRDDDYVALCASQKLKGFIEPVTAFGLRGTQVYAFATVVVTDCHGHVFYAGSRGAAQERTASQTTDQQIDAAQAVALTTLIADAKGFVAAHQLADAALHLTGNSLLPGDPVVSGAAASVTCNAQFQQKHYQDALATCSLAKRNLAEETQFLNILMRIPSPASADQTTVITVAPVVPMLNYIEAESNAKLNHKSEAHAAALLCAEWIYAVTGYMLVQFPDHSGERFKTVTNEMAVVSVELEKSFPGIMKEAAAAQAAERAAPQPAMTR